MKKNGAPITEVKIPNGISEAKNVLQHMSTSTKKAAPMRRDAGRTILLSGPKRKRAICGMIKPTQPIIPAIATTEEVKRVAQTIFIIRKRSTCTPKASASTSPNASEFRRHLKSNNGIRPKQYGTKNISKSFQVTFAMEPISQ